MVCEEKPGSMSDCGCMMFSQVEDGHSSNGAVSQEPVGGGKEVDDMAKEVKEDGDDLASSDTVAEENQCGLELTCKGAQVDTIVEETQCGVGNILGVEARMGGSLLEMAV
ncbi:unnamed protein product [Camellia sinensis]